MKPGIDLIEFAQSPTQEWMTCSICGYKFDPSVHGSCQGCPLQKGCQLVCCPACGYEMVNIQRSSLVRFASKWLKAGHNLSA